MSEVLYLRQTFTDCVSNQNTHFDMLTCQMQLKVMEGSLVLLFFYTKFFIKLLFILWKVIIKIDSTCYLAICNCML